MNEYKKVEGVVLISEPSHEYLNEKQLVSYKEHRTNLITWLTTEGKNPKKLEGYAHDTSKSYATILDKFYRWKWTQNGGYTTDIKHDDAEQYLKNIVVSNDYSSSYQHNISLAFKAYFRWLPGDEEFDPDYKIKSTSSAANPKDYLTLAERTKFKEAALEYDSVPSYNALTAEKRSEWKKFLSHRYEKSIDNITEQDFKEANGYKYVSIIYTALDAGLRPIEVGRMKTYMIDVENSVIRVPAKDSSKGDENWSVSITDETAAFLARWLKERNLKDKYNDTDQLWLTRHNNPYSSSGLRPLLENICEIAGIERDISWYAIRHSTGTYMTREEGLSATQNQLRHEQPETTMKYDQAPVEDRRDALDRMG